MHTCILVHVCTFAISCIGNMRLCVCVRACVYVKLL